MTAPSPRAAYLDEDASIILTVEPEDSLDDYQGLQRWLTPADVITNDESIRIFEYPDTDWWWEYEPTDVDIGAFTQSPLADDVVAQDGQTISHVPDDWWWEDEPTDFDIGAFTYAPLSDNAADESIRILEYPDTDWWWEEEPTDFDVGALTQAPLSDNAPDESIRIWDFPDTDWWWEEEPSEVDVGAFTQGPLSEDVVAIADESIRIWEFPDSDWWWEEEESTDANVIFYGAQEITYAATVTPTPQGGGGIPPAWLVDLQRFKHQQKEREALAQEQEITTIILSDDL